MDLRNDPRVIVKERTNIRYVTNEDIGELVDFITIDVSFISLKLVLPVAKELMKQGGSIMALIKPQFEAGKDKVGKKGLVKDRLIHKEVIENMVKFSNAIQLNVMDLGYSPITGSKGNIEFLSYIIKHNDTKTIDEEKIIKIIETAHRNLYE